MWSIIPINHCNFFRWLYIIDLFKLLQEREREKKPYKGHWIVCKKKYIHKLTLTLKSLAIKFFKGRPFRPNEPMMNVDDFFIY